MVPGTAWSSVVSAHQNVLGLVDTSRKIRRPPVVGMEFLHQRPMRANDIVARRPLVKAQDLISLILGHHARTGSRVRAAAPRVCTLVMCRTPSGNRRSR